MTTQPEALRLADQLEDDKWGDISDLTAQSAADELRRLHALVSACEPFLKENETETICRLYAEACTLNAELLKALRDVVNFTGAHGGPYVKARAAITKATGEKA